MPIAQGAAVRVHEIWKPVKETAKDWLDDDAPTLAAAFRYYALLSLAPLLAISVGVAGWVKDKLSAKAEQIRAH